MGLLKRILFIPFLFQLLPFSLGAQLHLKKDTLWVGIAGSAPFVEDTSFQTGISLEVWSQVMHAMNIPYKTRTFADIPDALSALEEGKIGAVAGPVSISSARAEKVLFSQPYFQSSLSILSLKTEPTLWQRIAPFFSKRFFLAVCGFLFILLIVGSCLWLAEREANPKQFPKSPSRGIANGMWCAISTMTTTGYGDIAPKTFWGRFLAGAWMVISLVLATTMIAGIASTLTLTGMQSTAISSAEELSGKRIGVIYGTAAFNLSERYGAKTLQILDLKDGFNKLMNHKIDGVVFNKPELQYFNRQFADNAAIVSIAEYERQGLGFAFPLHSGMVHDFNIELLNLQESGVVNNIIKGWLGSK